MTPKEFIGIKAKYDDYGQFIWAMDKEGGLHKLADLRGWGAIQQHFLNKDGSLRKEEAEKFQDELGQWIVDAINEKLLK